jgi:hypothetical protein
MSTVAYAAIELSDDAVASMAAALNTSHAEPIPAKVAVAPLAEGLGREFRELDQVPTLLIR